MKIGTPEWEKAFENVPKDRKKAVEQFINGIPKIPFFSMKGKIKANWHVSYGTTWDEAWGAAYDKMDKIELRNVPYEQLKKGDVICYLPLNWVIDLGRKVPEYNQGIAQMLPKVGHSYICHRIDAVMNLSGAKVLLMKGDANRGQDIQIVDRSTYRGVVEWKTKPGSYKQDAINAANT